jgi:hypothetical protein
MTHAQFQSGTQELTTLREIFSEALRKNSETWSEDVEVSRETWLDTPIPCSCGDISTFPRPIEAGLFFVWTENFVYSFACDDPYYYVVWVPRNPKTKTKPQKQ